MISQPAVPETALKRRKRDEAWAAKKATADAEAAAASKKNSEEIFKRAEKYVKEYRDQVRFGETRPRVPHTNTSLFPTPARRRPAAARRERAKTRSDRRGGFGEGCTRRRARAVAAAAVGRAPPRLRRRAPNARVGVFRALWLVGAYAGGVWVRRPAPPRARRAGLLDSPRSRVQRRLGRRATRVLKPPLPRSTTLPR